MCNGLNCGGAQYHVMDIDVLHKPSFPNNKSIVCSDDLTDVSLLHIAIHIKCCELPNTYINKPTHTLRYFYHANF